MVEVPRKRLLTLMRHGHAVAATGHDDHDRALDERGRHDVRAVADRTAVREATPALVLCSDARRTVETAEIVRETLGLPAESLVQVARLYLASADTLIEIIDEHDARGVEHLMLIGHNPGLERLAMHLDPKSPRGLSTGSLRRYAREAGPIGGSAIGAERLSVRLVFADRP